MGRAEDQKRRRRSAAAKQPLTRYVKGMSNPLRAQIWAILHERVASPKEMSREIGAPFDKVNYETKALVKLGLAEKIAEQPVRGAVKNFYRAVVRAKLDEKEWREVPDEVKGDLRATLLQTITDDAIEAIAAGQYDARSDAHMSWMPMIVDGQGCGEVAQILKRALYEVLEVQETSVERLIAQDVEGISYTVSMLGYTSADERRKVGPPRDARQLVKELSKRKTQGRKKKQSPENAEIPDDDKDD